MMYSVAIVYKGNSPTISRFGDAWFQAEYPYPDPIYVDVANDPNQAGIADLIQSAQINRYPTILFLKDTGSGQRIITRLEGEQNQFTIAQAMRDVPAGLYEEGFNPDGTPDGSGLIDWNSILQSPMLLIVSGLILYTFFKDK